MYSTVLETVKSQLTLLKLLTLLTLFTLLTLIALLTLCTLLTMLTWLPLLTLFTLLTLLQPFLEQRGYYKFHKLHTNCTSVDTFEHCLLIFWKARLKIRVVRYCYDDNKCKISKEAKGVIIIATMAFTTCLPHVSSTEHREKYQKEKFERYLFTRDTAKPKELQGHFRYRKFKLTTKHQIVPW